MVEEDVVVDVDEDVVVDDEVVVEAVVVVVAVVEYAFIWGLCCCCGQRININNTVHKTTATGS